ncbi:MAG TPA: hypothetical protein VHG91_12070 [Longimicrobium sp.]|nr:hypothetical protein [Longimicrobium sp.]
MSEQPSATTTGLEGALAPASATFRFGALQLHLDLSGLRGGWVRYTLAGSGGEWEVTGENLSGRTSRDVDQLHLDGELWRGGAAVGTVEAKVETTLYSGEAEAAITLTAADGAVYRYEGPVAAWDDALTEDEDGGRASGEDGEGETDSPGGLGKLFG